MGGDVAHVRRGAGMLGAVVLALALAACGGSRSDAAAPSAAAVSPELAAITELGLATMPGGETVVGAATSSDGVVGGRPGLALTLRVRGTGKEARSRGVWAATAVALRY